MALQVPVGKGHMTSVGRAFETSIDMGTWFHTWEAQLTKLWMDAITLFSDCQQKRQHWLFCSDPVLCKYLLLNLNYTAFFCPHKDFYQCYIKLYISINLTFYIKIILIKNSSVGLSGIEFYSFWGKI